MLCARLSDCGSRQKTKAKTENPYKQNDQNPVQKRKRKKKKTAAKQPDLNNRIREKKKPLLN